MKNSQDVAEPLVMGAQAIRLEISDDVADARFTSGTLWFLKKGESKIVKYVPVARAEVWIANHCYTFETLRFVSDVIDETDCPGEIKVAFTAEDLIGVREYVPSQGSIPQ